MDGNGGGNEGGSIPAAKGLKVNAGGRNGAAAPTCEADGPTEEGDPQGELALGGGVV